MAKQKDELEAVLTGMVQGVLAVDRDDKLISINDAAARLLGTSREEALGHDVKDIIVNADLLRVVIEALRSDDPVEGYVVLASDDGSESEIPAGRFVRVQDTKLFDAQGKRIGKMIALQDVTHLRQLESIRRDFVANVSHEIRTPVTAIKLAAETLLDAPVPEPDDARRFIKIIARQADSLHAIVEDLLALARIEQDVDQKQVTLSTDRLSSVLDAAIEACQANAQDKSIRIERSIPDECSLGMNSHLLQRALINLLDNAIKYSRPKTTVYLSGSLHEGECVLSVRDEGPGIAAEHLPRLFERFYRIDKARSRELGGTGLGLAIVRHIALAHGGRVTVTSELGRGSTFSIHLPMD